MPKIKIKYGNITTYFFTRTSKLVHFVKIMTTACPSYLRVCNIVIFLHSSVSVKTSAVGFITSCSVKP